MSKATLTLRRAIWHEGASKRMVEECLNEGAVELENRIKAVIDTSVPQGRIRRLSTVTSRFSARGVGNKKRGTSTRMVTGANFYQASAPGQPPAKRTGALYRDIKVRRVGHRSIRASVNKKYARILDDPNRLNRPFFKGTCRDYFRNEFRPKVKERLQQLIHGT